MVIGGYSGSSILDSTEIFSDKTWRTVAGKLPAGMGMSMGEATINNRVQIFGNQFFVDEIKIEAF